MSDHEDDKPDPREPAEDELLEAQEHKGYGEDEGERDALLDDEQ
jgi:hypothetical protein